MRTKNRLAILRLRVADEVPVFPLSVFLSQFRNVYASHIFLDKVEYENVVPPPDFLPAPDEDLYVNRLEIGTPNFIELIGQADAIIHTANWVLMLATGLKGLDFVVNRTLQNVKTYYEGRKLRLECKKIENVMRSAQADGRLTTRLLPPPDPSQRVDRRAETLKGRLPDQQVLEKSEFMISADQWMVHYALSPGILSDPEIILIEGRDDG